MDWGSLENLKWFWLAGGVLLGFLFAERQRRNRLGRLGDLKILEQMSSTLNPSRRRWKQWLFLGAVFLVTVCLLEPRLPGKSVLVKKRGLDIVLAVDVSQSMLTEDILPNRLTKAKLELQEFVEKARGDRLGVLAFAGEAQTQVPLTLDRSAVKLFLRTLSPELIPTPGTSIGDAIRAGTAMFLDQGAEDRILVLLTDGEDQESDPLGAAREARRKGVRIYAIGIGTPKGEVIPIRKQNKAIAFKKDLRGNLVISKLDEKTLQDITAQTRGVYYRSHKGNLEVDRIYSDIRNLGMKETGSGWVMEHEPLYQYPLLLAILILCTEAVLSERSKGS